MTVYMYAHTATGGHLRYTREIADGLTGAGIPTVLLTGSPDVQTKSAAVVVVPTPDLTARGIGWLVNRLATYLKQILFLRTYVRRTGVGEGDVFHFQELPSVLPRLAVSAASRTGARTALTVHNVRPHAGNRTTGRWVARLHSRQWRRFDVLIVHSTRLRDALLAEHQEISPDHVVVIPHPVWREPNGATVEPTKDYVVFGVLRRNKGIDLFIDALAALGDPLATIAGAITEDYEAILRQRISARRLVNCDLRVGFVDDAAIPSLLASHRVVVLPYTQFAAQSGVLNQAIASDRPVVVTDVGALGDLVREYRIGEVARSTSPSDIADAMRTCNRASTDGEYRENLADVRKYRSIEVIAREHEYAYGGQPRV